ncbi:MAG: helix-turn-helix domain-containing protein [candidate division NC10 bacterium]|nr:helix-turn-helix domain-containing protein [candidate division NC10 bacterium]
MKTQIGRRLRRIRRMRDLTQKELANTIVGRVDYTYIGKIERGEQRIFPRKSGHGFTPSISHTLRACSSQSQSAGGSGCRSGCRR